jgi:hypothetical protein
VLERDILSLEVLYRNVGDGVALKIPQLPDGGCFRQSMQLVYGGQLMSGGRDGLVWLLIAGLGSREDECVENCELL